MRQKALWCLLFAVSMCTGGMYGPLVRLSHTDGRIGYDTTQVVFLNELVKFTISLVLLAKTSSISGFSLQECLPYSIPGFCYFINNNLSFYILTELDPATFSVLSNIKIVTTTVLYVLVMRRYPNRLQLLALVMLTAASVIHSYGTSFETISATENSMHMKVSLYGILMLLFAVSNSSFAAIYTEFIVKKNFHVSLYKQNAYLYVTGMMFNCGPMIWRSAAAPELSNNFITFTGFNLYTWLIIGNTVLQGLSISVLMKYSTNITRLVMNCSSLVISSSMSIVLFNFSVSVFFLISATLVVFALVLYNLASRPAEVRPFKFIV
ncbi:probable UDP-sugar transporter protein SLC35A4 [Watersipora subatra]|uniref:probable UDP-sugar transporter protein SLC35A4 n=1 Tax=Watersipora subatra TaxID=2589382 RepID=UPI00355B8B3F